MGRVVLVRHGETAWNREKRIQSHIDIGLSALGLLQAQAVAEYMASHPEGDIKAIYSSDLARAYDTATAIARATGTHVQLRRELREVDLGEFAGRTPDEVKLAFPGFSDERKKNPLDHPYPGGETLRQSIDRACIFLSEIYDNHPDETVLAVGHGGLIKLIICHLVGLEPVNRFRFTVSNASVSVVEIHGARPVSGRVIRINDCHHLTGVCEDGELE